MTLKPSYRRYIISLHLFAVVDRDCSVWRKTLQLFPLECGAVALVSVCGDWRAAMGAGK